MEDDNSLLFSLGHCPSDPGGFRTRENGGLQREGAARWWWWTALQPAWADEGPPWRETQQGSEAAPCCGFALSLLPCISPQIAVPGAGGEVSPGPEGQPRGVDQACDTGCVCRGRGPSCLWGQPLRGPEGQSTSSQLRPTGRAGARHREQEHRHVSAQAVLPRLSSLRRWPIGHEPRVDFASRRGHRGSSPGVPRHCLVCCAG